MKPLNREILGHAHYLQTVPPSNAAVSIRGSTSKLGERYKKTTVVLYNKTNLMPLAITKSNNQGDYQFLGLNTDLKTFVVAFDPQQEYNAVISDNVVPK